MSQDPNRSGRKDDRYPAALVVSYRLSGREAFVERYSANVSKGGIFIVTHEQHAVGTELDFEIRTSDGASAFRGRGVVRWTRVHDPAKNQLPGLGLQFVSLDDENRAVLEQMLQRQMGHTVAPPRAATPEGGVPAAALAGPPVAPPPSTPVAAPPPAPVAPTPPSTQPPAPPSPVSPGIQPRPSGAPPAPVLAEAAEEPARAPASTGVPARMVVLVALATLALGLSAGWYLHGFLQPPAEPPSRVPVATVPPEGLLPKLPIAQGAADAAALETPDAHVPDAGASEPEQVDGGADAGEANWADAGVEQRLVVRTKKLPRLKTKKLPVVDAGEAVAPVDPEVMLEQAIRSGLRAKQPQVQLCYEKVLKKKPELELRLAVTLSTDANGKVQKVKCDTGGDSRGWEVCACIRNALKTMALPGLSQEVEVEVPLHLTPRRFGL